MSIEREDAQAIARDYVQFVGIPENLDHAIERINREYVYTDFTEDDLEMIREEIEKESEYENRNI